MVLPLPCWLMPADSPLMLLWAMKFRLQRLFPGNFSLDMGNYYSRQPPQSRRKSPPVLRLHICQTLLVTKALSGRKLCRDMPLSLWIPGPQISLFSKALAGSKGLPGTCAIRQKRPWKWAMVPAQYSRCCEHWTWTDCPFKSKQFQIALRSFWRCRTCELKRHLRTSSLPQLILRSTRVRKWWSPS